MKFASGRRCRHCGQKRICRPRRLCHSCYAVVAIRDQYPAAPKKNDREPTMAELEQTIAEQLKCLPAWWTKEKGK